MTELTPSGTALVLIDVIDPWALRGPMEIDFTFQPYVDLHTERVLVPFVERMRNAGLGIVHACLPHGPIPKLVDDGDSVISPDTPVEQAPEIAGFDALLYAGYVLNLCLLHRPCGVLRAAERFDGDVVLIRDATLAYDREGDHARAYRGAICQAEDAGAEITTAQEALCAFC